MKRFLLIFITLVFAFSLSACRIQITPEHQPNTKWVSAEPDIYFETFEDAESEGYLNMNGESIHIYVMWTPGSQCVFFYDADTCYSADAILYFDGYGHWKKDEYIVEIDRDFIGIGTTEIVFSKEQ